VAVFRSVNRSSADIVARMLSACGIHADVWGTRWTAIAQLNPSAAVSRVPNEFNSHTVMVRRRDADLAQQLIAATPIGESTP
jgi:hypothetical protein